MRRATSRDRHDRRTQCAWRGPRENQPARAHRRHLHRSSPASPSSSNSDCALILGIDNRHGSDSGKHQPRDLVP